MTVWQKSVLVFVGAGVGANLRYWIGVAAASRFGSAFPWGTLAINVTGSFALGWFVAAAMRNQWSEGLVLLVAVGLLGGYTTFSTFSLEALNLLGSKQGAAFALYVASSCAISLIGAWLGSLLA